MGHVEPCRLSVATCRSSTGDGHPVVETGCPTCSGTQRQCERERDLGEHPPAEERNVGKT